MEIKDSEKLIRTLETLFASSYALDDMNEYKHSNAGLNTINLQLLAAADSDIPELPQESWSDLHQMVEIKVQVKNDALQIDIQAAGLNAIEQLQNKSALLVSLDGVIRVKFKFDQRGKGFMSLANSERVRSAISSLSLHVQS